MVGIFGTIKVGKYPINAYERVMGLDSQFVMWLLRNCPRVLENSFRTPPKAKISMQIKRIPLSQDKYGTKF